MATFCLEFCIFHRWNPNPVFLDFFFDVQKLLQPCFLAHLTLQLIQHWWCNKHIQSSISQVVNKNIEYQPEADPRKTYLIHTSCLIFLPPLLEVCFLKLLSNQLRTILTFKNVIWDCASKVLLKSRPLKNWNAYQCTSRMLFLYFQDLISPFQIPTFALTVALCYLQTCRIMQIFNYWMVHRKEKSNSCLCNHYYSLSSWKPGYDFGFLGKLS